MTGLAGGGTDTQAVDAVLLLENGLPLSFSGRVFISAWACVAPFCFYTAAYLLRRGVPGKEQRYFTSNKVLALLVVLTVIPIVLGGALLFLGIFDMLMNGSRGVRDLSERLSDLAGFGNFLSGKKIEIYILTE